MAGGAITAHSIALPNYTVEDTDEIYENALPPFRKYSAASVEEDLSPVCHSIEDLVDWSGVDAVSLSPRVSLILTKNPLYENSDAIYEVMDDEDKYINVCQLRSHPPPVPRRAVGSRGSSSSTGEEMVPIPAPRAHRKLTRTANVEIVSSQDVVDNSSAVVSDNKSCPLCLIDDSTDETYLCMHLSRLTDTEINHNNIKASQPSSKTNSLSSSSSHSAPPTPPRRVSGDNSKDSPKIFKTFNHSSKGTINSMLANSTHILCTLGQSMCKVDSDSYPVCNLRGSGSLSTQDSSSVDSLDITISPRERHGKPRGRDIKTVKPWNDALKALGEIVNKGEDPNVRYNMGEQVSEGASGVVHIARDNVTDKVVAIKLIDIDKQMKLGLIVKELKALTLLKHSNVVDYKASYLVDRMLWIVTEYLDVGCLTKLCTHMVLDECTIATITREVLRGLSYLHSCRVIHRDIKSDNVLVGDDGSVKIADFGFCAQLRHDKDMRNTHGGTVYWMSPEVVKDKPYNEKTDIWSLGIMIMEMIQSEPPYMDDSPFKAMQKIVKKGRPKLNKDVKISDDLDKFLDLCLQKKSDKRASADALLLHPFITKYAASKDRLVPLIEGLSRKLYS